MKMRFSKRSLLISLGIISGIAATLINNWLVGDRLAFAQMVIWTVLVFGIVAIQANESLWRPKQLCVALALMALHIIGLIKFANHFPLNNMIAGFIGAGFEVIILIFLYVRIGQTVDPKGPYGLTESEIRRRREKSDRFR